MCVVFRVCKPRGDGSHQVMRPACDTPTRYLLREEGCLLRVTGPPNVTGTRRGWFWVRVTLACTIVPSACDTQSAPVSRRHDIDIDLLQTTGPVRLVRAARVRLRVSLIKLPAGVRACSCERGATISSDTLSAVRSCRHTCCSRTAYRNSACSCQPSSAAPQLRAATAGARPNVLRTTDKTPQL